MASIAEEMMKKVEMSLATVGEFLRLGSGNELGPFETMEYLALMTRIADVVHPFVSRYTSDVKLEEVLAEMEKRSKADSVTKALAGLYLQKMADENKED